MENDEEGEVEISLEEDWADMHPIFTPKGSQYDLSLNELLPINFKVLEYLKLSKSIKEERLSDVYFNSFDFWKRVSNEILKNCILPVRISSFFHYPLYLNQFNERNSSFGERQLIEVQDILMTGKVFDQMSYFRGIPTYKQCCMFKYLISMPHWHGISIMQYPNPNFYKTFDDFKRAVENWYSLVAESIASVLLKLSDGEKEIGIVSSHKPLSQFKSAPSLAKLNEEVMAHPSSEVDDIIPSPLTAAFTKRSISNFDPEDLVGNDAEHNIVRDYLHPKKFAETFKMKVFSSKKESTIKLSPKFIQTNEFLESTPLFESQISESCIHNLFNAYSHGFSIGFDIEPTSYIESLVNYGPGYDIQRIENSSKAVHPEITTTYFYQLLDMSFDQLTISQQHLIDEHFIKNYKDCPKDVHYLFTLCHTCSKFITKGPEIVNPHFEKTPSKELFQLHELAFRWYFYNVLCGVFQIRHNNEISSYLLDYVTSSLQKLIEYIESNHFSINSIDQNTENAYALISVFFVLNLAKKTEYISKSIYAFILFIAQSSNEAFTELTLNTLKTPNLMAEAINELTSPIIRNSINFIPKIVSFYSVLFQIDPTFVSKTILTNCDWASSSVSALSQSTTENVINNAYLISCITKFLERCKKKMSGVNSIAWGNECPKIQGLLAAIITYGKVEVDTLLYLLQALVILFAEKMSLNFFTNEILSLQVFGSLNQIQNSKITILTWKIFRKALSHNIPEINNLIQLPGFSKPIELLLYRDILIGSIELIDIITRILPAMKNNNEIIAFIHFLIDIRFVPQEAVTRIKQKMPSRHDLVTKYQTFARSKPQLIQMFSIDNLYLDSLLKKKRRKSKF